MKYFTPDDDDDPQITFSTGLKRDELGGLIKKKSTLLCVFKEYRGLSRRTGKDHFNGS
jgi:hypothetical protein